ncbi:MAG: response regulator transcription factor [Pseudomonadales bacterium]|nr:response regulator transcription factor [Pseudomonadales bacterium]
MNVFSYKMLSTRPLGEVTMANIALIEDEPPLSEQYEKALRAGGHTVTPFLNIADAQKGLKEQSFDAWVLDLQLDGVSAAGVGLISWAEKKNLNAPTLVVSGLDQDPHMHYSLAAGAWDFATKPIESALLVHKVNLLLNANSSSTTGLSINNIENLEINPDEPCEVYWNKERFSMPLTAWNILRKLAAKPDETVEYRTLLSAISPVASKPTLRQHITTIRKAFDAVDPEFDHINVVSNAGYSWKT